MFLPRIEALPVSESRVQLLRLSLNTPVVSTAELPVGPARAALLLLCAGDEGSVVTLGIRSLRTGDVVLYGLDPSQAPPGPGEPGFLQEAALTFAEGMGFLFDEDELADGGDEARARGYGLWVELMGEACVEAAAAPAAPVASGASAEPDLDFDSKTPLEHDLLDSGSALDLGSVGVELGPELEDVPSQPVLQSPPDPTATPPPDPLGGTQTRAALGRVKLVKRARPKGRGEALDPILRLLSSF